MKITFIFLLICCFAGELKSQNTISARYKVIKYTNVPTSEHTSITAETEFEGVLYRAGNKIIVYQLPTYLQQYPTGSIPVYSENGVKFYIDRSTDTIQSVYLFHTDSLQTREWSCLNTTSYVPRQYSKFIFENGSVEWRELKETKTFNGYVCPKMQAYSGQTKKLIFEGWVYKDISAGFSFSGLRDVPGIVLEGRMTQLNLFYTLTTLKQGDVIPEEVFWPDIFKDAKFTDYGTINKKKKETDKKRADIMNQ